MLLFFVNMFDHAIECNFVNTHTSLYIFLGSAIRLTPPMLCFRQIRDTVNWIFCEQMLVCYISVFKDTFWPNGKLAPHVKVRTDSERSETKERAQQKLLDNIPGMNTCKDDF